MAAFALIGLAIALGIIALAGLRPWATSSVAPNLSLSPAIGAALGDATVVAQAGSPEVGNGGTAAPESSRAVVVSAGVATPARRALTSPVLAVAPARALSTSRPTPTPSPPVSEPAPTPEPAAAAPVPPVEQAPAPALAVAPQPAAPGTPAASGGPSTAGVGGGELGPSCEGGEYVITVTFEEEAGEEGYGESEAEILIQGVAADGSEEELELRGDLSDVHSLVETLVSEGSCVRVDIVPFDEGELPPEVVEPGAVPAEPGDDSEPVLP
jgi:hypothetical protein